MAVFEIEKSFTKIDLSNSSSYTEIYSYSGKGRLESFWVRFNSDNVFVRLEIDGSQVFEIDCDDLENNAPAFDEDGYEMFHSFGSINWHRGRNILKFEKPLTFGTEIKIEAKANSSSTSRDMIGYIIDIGKYND